MNDKTLEKLRQTREPNNRSPLNWVQSRGRWGNPENNFLSCFISSCFTQGNPAF